MEIDHTNADLAINIILRHIFPIWQLAIVHLFIQSHILLCFIKQRLKSIGGFFRKGKSGGLQLEHKTCDILAAERLRLMRFDHRLIIDSFQKAICILKW